MTDKKIFLVRTEENPSPLWKLDDFVELTPLIKREIIKQTMKEIQELYYDIEEPQEDYDWHCDKGMIKRAIISTIEHLKKLFKEEANIKTQQHCVDVGVIYEALLRKLEMLK